MSEMWNFSFDDHTVRAMSDEQGLAWLVGKDVCKILGFKNTNEAMKDHCLNEATFISIATSGGIKETRVLGPIDVLQLIRRSTLPVPERFESWLIQEVWPALCTAQTDQARAAHQAQLDQVHAILKISDALITAGVSPRKSISIALNQLQQQKRPAVEPFQTQILARIAAQASANEGSSECELEPCETSNSPQQNPSIKPMTKMTTFTFDDHTVRAMGDEQGLAWLVGKDVCKILGFKDPGKAMAVHCLGGTKLLPITDSMGRAQEVRILAPLDMLQLIRRSTLPVPERFESWLIQEVWPTLYTAQKDQAGAAHQAQLDQVHAILKISDAVIKAGVSPRKSLSVALDMIQAQTGMRVAPFKDLLRRRISPGADGVDVGEATSPVPLKALQTGDLSEDAVQAWKDFMALSLHERCLRLCWLAGTRTRAAVLWQFCERHHRRAAIGSENSAVRVSASDIADRAGSIFGCSVSGVRSTMSDMIQEGVLHALPHVDNVTRKIWLDWPVLQAALESAQFPELIFLELNWVAKNKAEMVVLHALTVATNQTISKLSPSALESQYRAMVDIDAMALTRAVKSLMAAGLIEQGDVSDSRCIRLVPGKVGKLMEQFYLDELQKHVG